MKKLLICCAGLLVALGVAAQTAKTTSETVDCGSGVTITATPKAGFHFVKWINLVTSAEITDGVNTLTLSNINEVQNYKAVFAVNVVDFGEGVTVVPANPNVGEQVTLTVNAESVDVCFQFKQWSDGNTDSPRVITYTGTETFKAEYELKHFQVNITVDDESQGTITIAAAQP